MAWATASSAEGWSLEGRLRNRLLLALLALWLLGSGLSLYVHWTESNELLDAAQEETAATLLRLPAPAAPHVSIEPLAGSGDDRPPVMLMQVYTSAGRLVWRSTRAPDAPLAPLSRRGTIDEGDWRVVVRHAPEVDRIVVVGASLQGRRDALVHAVEAQLLPLLALLPLTALTVTWLLRSVFVRLDEVRGELRRRDTDQLDPLDGPGLPRELQPLVATLNQLFARLTEVRQAERAFAANSAHELRTPLAAAQAQLQRLAHELRERAHTGSPGELDGAMQRAEAVARQLDRLERVCVKLLQLSRAEAGVGRHTVPLDLVEVTRLVLEDFHQPDQRGRLRLCLPPPDLHALAGGTESHVMALGDVDALGIALRNLVENALLHGGRQIEVRIGHEPAITVADDGPGVAPSRLAGLQRPFVRGESASSPGHGLGLAIVATLARQMNGRLVLESPLNGASGFAATLVLQPVPDQVQSPASCPDDACR